MQADRTASTSWSGEIKTGTGSVSLDSSRAAGPLDVSFATRAGEPDGQTSPEELIAAAQASDIAMAMASALGSAGYTPERLDTSATVTFSMEGGPHIAGVALTIRGQVPGMDADAFVRTAEQAKDGCPVSKLIAGNADVSVDAELA